jgi:integrase
MASNRKRRGRQEGSIYRRNDGLWAASVSAGYDDKGRRKRRVVYGATKQEAQNKLHEVLQQAANGQLDQTKMTVSACLDFWLDGLKMKQSPTTFKRYSTVTQQQIKPRLGRVPLVKLSPFHVSNFYREMAADNKSTDLQNRSGRYLRQCLHHAVRLELIQSNPAAKVPLPRVTKAKIHPLDGGQVASFLKATEGDRLHALYYLALDSGCRQGELFALERSDLDLARGEITVTKSLEELNGQLRVKEVKTPKGKRRIELAQSTVMALREHLDRMDAEGHGSFLLFCDTAGKHLRKGNTLRRSFKPALQAAGLPAIRFHDLRHTTATLLLLAGVNIKMVSERLGHATVELTLNTYSHVLPAMQQQAADQMDAILTQRPGHP